VAGQIIPWNFPLLMLAWKVAPALATGSTVVLKPAEYTPLTALRFAELCADLGLPPGVLNIVTGDGRTGAALVDHPDVDKIAFTGSTEVGRAIRVATAGSGKRLSLELGGKSPFVVFEDAELDSVVEGVVDAIWFNQGQVCCAGSRILVQEGVADTLVAKLRARMERLRVGDPLDKGIDIGAIVAPVQLERIQAMVRSGLEEGATCWQPSWSCPEEGLFYPPTLLTDVAPAATVAQEEIFGPVAVLLTFRTHEEAVALANNTRFGLAASVWSESVNLALHMAPRIKAGTVWVNATNLFDAAAGFGGYRESGFGREGGREGLLEYLRPVVSDDAASATGAAGHARGPADAVARAGGVPEDAADAPAASAPAGAAMPGQPSPLPPVDRTAKLYIGGKGARPDGGYTLQVRGPGGALLGEVGQGNRKDVRNAVEAAHRATDWPGASAHGRAQVLYYVAENLAARRDEFARQLEALGSAAGGAEVDASVARLFTWAAWADKHDGAVHATPQRTVTMAMHEPMGVVGVVCPDQEPLLGFVALVAPALAMGNTVVAVPSECAPLAATDLYQVLDTSELPGGALNIVTGLRAELAPVLAAHDDVDAVWYHAADDGGAEVERLSAGNLKRTWIGGPGHAHAPGTEQAVLHHATQVKNIWVPYGA
ncbi:MAG: aldehyde dehydrogenase family protein, partial [Gemmatimonadota bacterium]